MSIAEQLLFTVEESIEDNFTTFHNNLFHLVRLGLSNDAGMLYLFIKSMAYGKKTFSFPSVQTLADQFIVKRRTIQRWMKELVDIGIINRIEWFNEKTGMQTSNRYILRDISKIELSPGYDKNVIPENTGCDKNDTPQITMFDQPALEEPTNLGCDKNVIPGATEMSHKEIQPKNMDWNELGGYEKVWPYVKAVGDMSIDPDSRLGFELINITLLEGANPDQLKDAIRELDNYTAAPVDNPIGFIRNKLRSYISGDQICFSAWRRDRIYSRT